MMNTDNNKNYATTLVATTIHELERSMDLDQASHINEILLANGVLPLNDMLDVLKMAEARLNDSYLI